MSRHDSRYDEGLERLAAHGPEYPPHGFTNHGPMAIEALAWLGRGDAIPGFLDWYAARLGPAPALGVPLPPDEQARALGDAAQYPRWHATFRAALAETEVRVVAQHWLPLLMPGCVAAALHGLLMATHALRGLESGESPPRIEALARGLAYWAACYQALPGVPTHAADGEPLAALLARTPHATFTARGAIDAAVGQRTAGDPAFATLFAGPRAQAGDPVAELASAGARALLARPSHSIIFIHAITGPAALLTLGRWLDAEALERATDYLWQAVAALLATYTQPEPTPAAEATGLEPDALVELALAASDEHAIKLVEAVLGLSGGAGELASAAEVACRHFGPRVG